MTELVARTSWSEVRVESIHATMWTTKTILTSGVHVMRLSLFMPHLTRRGFKETLDSIGE